MRYRPRPSIRTAPAGTLTCFAGPRAVIQPPSISTVWFGSTRSRSIGTTFTSTNARIPAGAPGTGTRAVGACAWIAVVSVVTTVMATTLVARMSEAAFGM
jgi:TRAP-type C4-dicarboxylate transport system permease large subunit